MSETVWDRAEAAMRAKRRELIAQPLDRVYGELLKAGFEHLSDELAKLLEVEADAAEENATKFRARAKDPSDILSPEDCLELADGWDDDAFHRGYNALKVRDFARQMIAAKSAGIPVKEA